MGILVKVLGAEAKLGTFWYDNKRLYYKWFILILKNKQQNKKIDPN